MTTLPSYSTISSPRRTRGLRLGVAAALALTAGAALACKSDDPVSPRSAGTVRLNVDDPTADTLDNATTGGALGVDVRQTVVRTKIDTVIFVLHFTRPVAAPSAQVASSIFGYVDIDADNDPTTGYPAVSDSFGGTSNIGVDFVVDLLNGNDQFATVGFLTADTLYTRSGLALAKYDGDSLVLKVPRPAIGGGSRDFAFTTSVGSLDGVSDIAPNTGAYVVSTSTTASVARGAVVSGGAAVGRGLVASGAPVGVRRISGPGTRRR
ncbi:MAG TPA: hypothetical protein VFJ74_11475 [Gemmatimonadaceae bacterium]|nr:hypothetical protein [Gemmatimonadaceae bacterium]